jgi:hypothetical protein
VHIERRTSDLKRSRAAAADVVAGRQSSGFKSRRGTLGPLIGLVDELIADAGLV